jgi:hypothetical protein
MEFGTWNMRNLYRADKIDNMQDSFYKEMELALINSLNTVQNIARIIQCQSRQGRLFQTDNWK